MTDLVFVASALVCLVSAMTIVTRKNPVYSVVGMLPFFLGMAVLFVLLQAPFLAAMEIMVYGGAILVLFLFVIMLINLRPEELRDDLHLPTYLGTALASGLLGGLLLSFTRAGVNAPMEAAFRAPVEAAEVIAFGSIESLGLPLFKQYIVPFELLSILIVVAILGAVILAKKKL